MGWPKGRALSKAHRRRIARAKRNAAHSVRTRVQQHITHDTSPVEQPRARTGTRGAR